MVMNSSMYRERECLHREHTSEGEFYNGTTYIKALQRLRSDAAMKMAGKVTPFFWSDAPHILVWLCQNCSSELRLNESSSVHFLAKVG
jgi:hypothetical protein